jgi:hypothetical protein
MAAAAATLAVAGCGSGGDAVPGAVSGLIGPAGGRLETGGIVVDVPPGAVPTVVEFLVAPLGAAQLPTPPNGLAAMAAGQFEVSGVMQFALPVSITFPLSARLPAGRTLTLWQYDGGWQDSLFDAVVAGDRRSVEAQVAHFTIYAVLADYAPLKVDAKWTYHRIVQITPDGGLRNPPQESTITATITGTEQVGGLDTFVWSESDPSNTKLYLHRGATELALVAIQEPGQALEVLPTPAKLLMLPPAAGQTWQVASLLDAAAQATVTAETITVGGVEYDAMKVHIAPSPPAGGYRDLWFAPEVGPVKWRQAAVDPGVSTTVVEMDLQSYSLP